MPDAKKKQRGPSPERLKLGGNWMTNVSKALTKKRPPKGWPKPKKQKG
jgi:hypothetical protein